MIFAPLLSWLAGKLGSVWTKVIEVAFVAIVIAAPFVVAYHSGKTNCENTVAQEQLKARVDAVTFLSKINQAGQEAVGDYVLRRGASAVFYQTLTLEVPRVTTLWKSSPTAPAQALPACIITRGFVGVWNRAFEAGDDVQRLPAVAERVADGSAATGPVDDADLLDSGVTRTQLLTNHIANANVGNSCAERFDAIRAWEKDTFGSRN